MTHKPFSAHSRFIPVAGLFAALLAYGAGRPLKAARHHGIRIAPVITVDVGDWIGGRALWEPGGYETYYTWQEIPGRWKNVTRTIREPGKWLREYVLPLTKKRVLPGGMVAVVCVRPGYYKRTWQPPKTRTVTERVWVPPTRRRVARRYWSAGHSAYYGRSGYYNRPLAPVYSYPRVDLGLGVRFGHFGLGYLRLGRLW